MSTIIQDATGNIEGPITQRQIIDGVVTHLRENGCTTEDIPEIKRFIENLSHPDRLILWITLTDSVHERKEHFYGMLGEVWRSCGDLIVEVFNYDETQLGGRPVWLTEQWMKENIEKKS